MTEIKISELSVGDWVKCNGFKATIAGYNAESGSIQLLTKQKNKMWFLIEDIEPIPLTPEILEKNGFRKNGEYNEWNIGEWNESPFIGISLDRQSMIVKYFGNDIFIENKVVFVHQLQHALRLAGMEKEIEV